MIIFMYLQTAARLAGMNRLSGLSASMRWRMPVSVATIMVSLSDSRACRIMPSVDRK